MPTELLVGVLAAKVLFIAVVPALITWRLMQNRVERLERILDDNEDDISELRNEFDALMDRPSPTLLSRN